MLQDLPYDTEIVIEGQDHNYRRAAAEYITALTSEGSDDIIEDYYTEQETLPAWYTGRINVLLVS